MDKIDKLACDTVSTPTQALDAVGEQDRPGFEELDAFILLKIFSTFTPGHLLSARLVCRRWSRVSAWAEGWQRLFAQILCSAEYGAPVLVSKSKSFVKQVVELRQARSLIAAKTFEHVLMPLEGDSFPPSLAYPANHVYQFSPNVRIHEMRIHENKLFVRTSEFLAVYELTLSQVLTRCALLPAAEFETTCLGRDATLLGGSCIQDGRRSNCIFDLTNGCTIIGVPQGYDDPATTRITAVHRVGCDVLVAFKGRLSCDLVLWKDPANLSGEPKLMVKWHEHVGTIKSIDHAADRVYFSWLNSVWSTKLDTHDPEINHSSSAPIGGFQFKRNSRGAKTGLIVWPNSDRVTVLDGMIYRTRGQDLLIEELRSGRKWSTRYLEEGRSQSVAVYGPHIFICSETVLVRATAAVVSKQTARSTVAPVLDAQN